MIRVTVGLWDSTPVECDEQGNVVIYDGRSEVAIYGMDTRGLDRLIEAATEARDRLASPETRSVA